MGGGEGGGGEGPLCAARLGGAGRRTWLEQAAAGWLTFAMDGMY